MYLRCENMEILPSMDLRSGQIVRLQQGDYARQINYTADPFETARSFQSAGASWMHVVDLDGAKEGSPRQTELISQIIRQSALHVQVGGGVRTEQDIARLLSVGAQRVVVGTAAFDNWHWFSQLVQQKEFVNRIVLAIDAKQGVVATRGWTKLSGRLAADVAAEVTDWPLAGLLYTDVAKDGMMTGVNIEQTQRVASAGRVPVIASGGVGNLSHLLQLSQINVWGVIIGRSLYEGTLDLRQAIESHVHARQPSDTAQSHRK